MVLPALWTLGLLRLSKVYHVKNLQNLKAENGWVYRLLTKKVFYESFVFSREGGNNLSQSGLAMSSQEG